VNSQITPVNSTILRNKLGRLAVRLQQQAKPQGTNLDFDTLEKVVTEASKILSQFYKNLSKPSYLPTTLVVDTLPDAVTYNNNFLVVLDDLTVVFNEFENLEGVLLGNFNYMVSRLNRLNRRLKSVSSQLGDYALFSDLPTRDAVFFGDSFNNLTRVEINSPLLNEEQCYINQVEGIATLPIDRNAQVALQVTEVPVINSNSNGRSGNNEEAGAQLHGTISDLLDNNADTWFEYERVVATDDGVDLVLDFTVNLGEAKIINFVRVNPNNFGARTQVRITAIDTSINGQEFVSIKDDIPIAGFTVDDEENVFTLAPSTSKFAGQGLYTFTPRKAKYVRLSLKQDTPYIIISSNGVERVRYAIGVRDVDIQALPYKTKGEVISTNFAFSDDVRKVVLLANQNPSAETTSELASVKHFVSPDNGVTWHQIRPYISAGVANIDQTVPELLDFNGVSDDTITTSSDVLSLRYRAMLERNTAAFTEDVAELAQVVADKTELHKPPTSTPMDLLLQHSPIKDSLRLIDPQFGSRGKEEARYLIATGTGGKLNILLPFKPLVRDMQKVESTVSHPVAGWISSYSLEDLDPQQVYVDGYEWTRGQLAGSNNLYHINFEEGRLEFGDGSAGNAVSQGSFVSMTLSEERLNPGRGASHISKLDYPTSNDQKQFELYLVKPAKTETVVLKKGAKRWQLRPNMVFLSANPANSIMTNNLNFFNYLDGEANPYREFVNGDAELTSAYQWSCDWENGVLYCYTASPTATDLTITYWYAERVRLDEADWEFIDLDGGIANAISIKDRVFQTFEADTLTVPDGVRYFNLARFSVVQGTVEFTKADGTTPDELAHEAEYADGHSELLGVVQAVEEIASFTGITPGDVETINFGCQLSNDTNLAVTFTNTDVFVTEKTYVDGSAELTSNGDYSISRTAGGTGQIYVKLADSVADPGEVSYYYINPQLDPAGYYSINYETGEVFTYSATPSSVVYADYEYTDYRAKYDIARLVPDEDWEFDANTKKITIQDREILRGARTPQQSGGLGTDLTRYYQAAYRYVKSAREDIDELEPFFSPVLKDYALKVVTKSRLV
jgi:hypothetical protein